MPENPSHGRRPLIPRRTAREAVVFAAVFALFIDGVLFISMADAALGGGAFVPWSAVKVLAIVLGIGWVAWDLQAWSLGIIAIIFAIIGLEDLVGITAPLGLWLIQESRIKVGPRGSNTQLLRRLAVMAGLFSPTIYLAVKAPPWLRRAVWTLIGFLGAIFVVAVMGDFFADRTGTNIDEVLEEPILSLCAGFSIGLVTERWPQRRLRSPTTGQRR